MKRVLYMLLCSVLLMTFLGGCDAFQRKYQKTYIGAFDTVTVIEGYALNEEAFYQTAEKLYEKLYEYHRYFDIYNTYDGINNIKTINDNAGKCAIEVDGAVIELLDFAVKMHGITEGKINIAMGSVLEIWHDLRQSGIESPENAELPSRQELLDVAEHTDINDLIINKEDNTVFIKDEGMSLDVGAVAKGFAVARVSEYAKSIGAEHMVINVGGNVSTIGTKANGNAWNIGIASTIKPESELECVVAISNMSLVTSGVYQRYYEVDGKKYHHIIDPKTLMPSEKYLSVSVICEDSGMADALSTALFNMDIDDGLALINSLNNTDALWILCDGKRAYSDGFEKYANGSFEVND